MIAASIFIWTIYISMLIINIWVAFAYFWICFDKIFFEKYCERKYQKELSLRKKSFKLIHGEKN